MPAKSKAQQRLMGADLTRARAGKKTKTGMTEQQLKEFASTPRKKLPAKKSKPTMKMPKSHAHMTPSEHKKAMTMMEKKPKKRK